MKKVLSALLLSTVLAMPAMAAEKEHKHMDPDADSASAAAGEQMHKHMEDADDMMSGPCGAEHHRVTMRVMWTIRDTKSMEDAKGKLDALLKQISDDASNAVVKSLVAQGVNYTLAPAAMKFDDGTHPTGYILNGRGEYHMDSESSAMKLADMLNKQNFQTEMEVRVNHLGRCVNTVAK